MNLRLALTLTTGITSFTLLAQSETERNGRANFDFEQTEHDFGWVLQDSKNPYVFRFRNNGDAPLVIESATGSCGCTVPHYSNAPIQPGEESEVQVEYSPGKQEGHQVKTVTIVANTEPPQTLLRIHAEVMTSDPGRPSAPYVFSPLPPSPVEPSRGVFDPLAVPAERSFVPEEDIPLTTVSFTEWEHDFGDVLQGSENPFVFVFKNTGDVPLVIENAVGSCGCTVPFYAKEPIPPGGESEIHVVYKPGKQQGTQHKTVTITANTEMRQNVLRIAANVLVVDSVNAPSLLLLEEEQEKDRVAIESVSPGCFVLFPNPASQELRLDLKEHIGQSADVRILDTAGKEMLRSRIASISSESSRLDVADFPSGVYIVTIQVDEGAPMSQCFVVDR